MRSSFRINRFKIVNKLLLILFSCGFMTNSQAAENLEITLSYYRVRNARIVKEIKLTNETYAKEKKKVEREEGENLKYEYYAEILTILKGIKPVFVHTSKAKDRGKVFDFAIINGEELHVSYNAGTIRDSEISLGMNIRYDNRVLYKGNNSLIQFSKPFMITQSRPYRDSSGRVFMSVLYVRVKLKGK